MNGKRGSRKSGVGEPMTLPAQIYHLAEAANWAAIQKQGQLLSASRLLPQSGLSNIECQRLEHNQRREHTELPNGVRIRDQCPLPPPPLEACLVDMTPADWYALVNRRVFFWLDHERLNRPRKACEPPRPQVVLVIDTAALVAAHGDGIAVTPINTGNARRSPARRGRATFVPYS
jgi:hypothetical protein